MADPSQIAVELCGKNNIMVAARKLPLRFCDGLSHLLMFAYFVVSLYCIVFCLLYCNGSVDWLCCFFVFVLGFI